MSCEILDKNHNTRAKATRMATTATARTVSMSCHMVICRRVRVVVFGLGFQQGFYSLVEEPDRIAGRLRRFNIGNTVSR